MATETELAMMAYGAYTVGEINKLTISTWTINRTVTTASGFSATVYENGSETVISFRGTDTDPLLNEDWVTGNMPAAAGHASPQVMDAIRLVAEIMATAGPNVSFTGHSLGGGLASLMAVFFDRPARVFDPAPFRVTAQGLEWQLDSQTGIGHFATSSVLADYFEGYAAYMAASYPSTPLNAAFQAYIDAAAVNVNAMLSARESNVTGLYLEGEFVTANLYLMSTLLGGVPLSFIGQSSLAQIPTGSITLTDSIELHSMGLLLAMMSSPSLQAASTKYPELLENIVDLDIYAKDYKLDNELNFLNRLLQDQLEGGEIHIGGALDRFAQDLLKLGEGGTTRNESIVPDIEKALITTIMEYYNFVSDLSDAVSFVETVSNGITFDTRLIPEDSDKLGQPLLLDSVKNLVTTGSGDLARLWADAADVWTIQSGSNGLTTIGLDDKEVQIGSASQANFLHGEGGNDLLIAGNAADALYGGAGRDVLLSGSGDDVLDGGANNDTLVGAEDNDTLIGGTGNDYLYGGADFDTYVFNAGDGFDVIKGDDNDGQIVINGITLTGANAYRSRTMYKTWYWQEGGQTFIGTLIPKTVAGGYSYDNPDLWVRTTDGSASVVVQDYATGDLGLELSSAQDATSSAPTRLMQDLQDQVEDAQRMTRVDPLILDLDGDGVETLNVTAGIHFDHDANGFAETTGWVGADDGLLVRDLNSNGLIDSGIELFGNNVLLADGSYAEHGFEALAELDSNGDGKLSSADTAFSQLRIWKDANSDGVTDAGELLTLSAAGVQSISTAYADGHSTDVNGNQHLQTGTYITTSGATRSMDDVWFAADWSDTINTTTVTVTAEIEALPDVAGFGNVASLHQAMMLDTSGHLQSLVTSYAAEPDAAARASLLQQIIFAWTDVESMAPDSRGSNVADARTVYALEAFLGEPFVMNNGSTTPTANAATQLLAAYNDLAAYINGQLLVQTHLQSLYEGMVLVLSADESSISWNVNGAVAQLQSVYDLDTQAGLELLNSLISNLKTNEESGSVILAALRAVGDLGATGLMRELALSGVDNSLLGTSDNDVLNSGATDELLVGLEGDDALSGNGGDDVLDGGAGNDSLSGGNGSDVYVFGYGSGQDVIDNYDLSTGRVDALKLGAGITASDIVVVRSGNDLIVKLTDTTDQVTVTNYFLGDTTAGYALDEFRFADGSVWSQSDINSFYLANAGTEEADTLSSFAAGSVLHGRGGNDTLTGGAGADSLYGDAGNDVISAGAGNDVVEGGAGNDTLNGGAGQNTYRFGVGDGTDTITYNYDSNTTKSNVLSFKEGVLSSDIVATRSGDDLVLTIAGTADSMRVQRFFYGDNPLSNNYSPVQQVSFADSTVWSVSDLVAKVFAGTDANDTIVGTINADTINGSVGNDSLYGRTGNDTLNGGDGNDSLYGEAGDDVFLGGEGNDALFATGGNDVFQFGLGDGHDVISGSHTVSETAELRFGPGISRDDIVVSQDAFDGITLAISGSSDAVSIKDYIAVPGYVSQTQDDAVKAIAFEGGDTVNLVHAMSVEVVSVSFADVNAVSVVGNDLDNTITGDVYSNALVGGKGVDTLIGGAGNDVYVVDTDSSYLTGGYQFYFWGDAKLNNYQDVVVEAAGQGVDTIYAYHVYSASLPDNVENMIVDGMNRWSISYAPANDVRRKFTGNALDNVIDASGAESVGISDEGQFSSGGMGGEIVIDGGAGADTMIGPDGKTRYVVDNVNDVVIAGSGITTIESYIDYTLASTYNHLTLAGSAAITGTGNALNNIIDGSKNTAANLLTGGLGNDTYLVGAGDLVQEVAGEGVDTVKTNLTSYTMADGIENLTLTGEGTGDSLYQAGYGNDLDNVIVGATRKYNDFWAAYGSNTLSGGAGNDVLWGEGQSDTLYGGDGDDVLYGDSDTLNISLHGNDMLFGGSGDDSLYGFSGNDYLFGEDGNDFMNGSVGNDLYGFATTAGLDTIADAGGVDTIEVSQVLDVEQLQFSRTGDDLALTFNGQDGIVIKSWYSSASQQIDVFKFRSEYGSLDYVYTAAQVQGRADGVNTAPVVGVTEGQSARTGELFEYQIPDYVFFDIESQHSMIYVLSMADGTELPAWLIYNSSTKTLSGTPPASAAGSVLEIKIAGTDAGGLVADATFSMDISFGAIVGTEGDDALNGDDSANTIYGLQGQDTLSGLDGDDWLLGGEDNDTYYGGAGSDWLDDWEGTGDDVLHGGDGDDGLWGGYGNDTYYGDAGNDYLDDWDRDGNDYMDGGTGADEMWAGLGDDIYIVDNTGDLVGEELDQGIDEVRSSVAYALTDNVENLTLTGTSASSGTGNALNNVLTGNSANNTLTGGEGNDTLNGGSGSDTMLGGLGNDIYVVAQTGDVVTESASEGTDLVQSSITYTLGNNVENLTLTGSSAINGTGNMLDNILTGNSGNNTLTGNAGNDTLDGGSGTDTMVGGAGNDVYYVNVSSDVTTESANAGIDTVNSSVTRTLASNIELLFLTGTTAINGTGNTLANLLRGNTGINTLAGGGGNDILEGGAGNDILSNTSGNTLLNGGAGTDTLTSTANNDLLIGGIGNDALTTGQGADIIAFNKGDGQDTVAVSTTKDNTLSIGGGTVYADLLFQKSGNNLILKVGASDQITFTNYYASTSNRSVNKLQVVLEGSADYVPGGGDTLRDNKIETFDFGGLVAAFDAALVANPSLTSWALSNALLPQYLSGSDTAALGGDLAYQYGRYGNEANVSYTPAIGILGSASFGTAVQTLQSLASLQDSSPRLS